jgi:hypothetical protein
MTNQSKNKSTEQAPIQLVAPTTVEQGIKLALDRKVLTQRIESRAKKRLESLKADQDIAIQCMIQAFAFDNWDYMSKFFFSLSAQSEAQGKQLKEWFCTFSPTKFVKGKNGYTFRKDTGEKAKAFDFVAAQAKPWYKMELFTEKEAKAMLFSLEMNTTALQRMVAKMDAVIADQTKLAHPEELSVLKLRRAALVEIMTEPAFNIGNTNDNSEGEGVEKIQANG